MMLSDKKILIEGLIESNCIKKGLFTLKNGESSKYYFNMKNLISKPKLLKFIGDEIYESLPDFDIICGIPYGGLPIASYISTKYNKPMIIIRDKQKQYGMQNLIEGEYKKSDRCIIIDDVLTTGGSIIETYEILKNIVNVIHIHVILDRQQHYDLPFKLFYNYLLCKNDVVRYYLKETIKQKKSKICFSADLTDPNKLFNILELVGPYILICKIHYDIIDISSYDGNFIHKICELSIKHNFLIMEDRKLVDISYIVEKQYDKFKNWIDLITVHGSSNKDVVKNLSGVLLVSNMSNNDFNYDDKCIDMYNSNKNNIIGFITQYRIGNKDMMCMTPGVSHLNHTVNDQKYRNISEIDTDIFIIGRAIYNSDNYVESIQRFM